MKKGGIHVSLAYTKKVSGYQLVFVSIQSISYIGELFTEPALGSVRGRHKEFLIVVFSLYE